MEFHHLIGSVDISGLLLYESPFSFNINPDDQVHSKFYSILNETLSNLSGGIEYIIVYPDRKDLTEEFFINKSLSYKEIQVMKKVN